MTERPDDWRARSERIQAALSRALERALKAEVLLARVVAEWEKKKTAGHNTGEILAQPGQPSGLNTGPGRTGQSRPRPTIPLPDPGEGDVRAETQTSRPPPSCDSSGPME